MLPQTGRFADVLRPRSDAAERQGRYTCSDGCSIAKEVLMLRRDVRYQAAIIHENHVLLLKVIDAETGAMFWLLPGGGREAGESEEACVRREVREETELEVSVLRPLFEAPDGPGGIYNRLRTYLCQVVGGEARPGIEPEDRKSTRLNSSHVKSSYAVFC